jgi:hypothetical protein
MCDFAMAHRNRAHTCLPEAVFESIAIRKLSGQAVQVPF